MLITDLLPEHAHDVCDALTRGYVSPSYMRNFNPTNGEAGYYCFVFELTPQNQPFLYNSVRLYLCNDGSIFVHLGTDKRNNLPMYCDEYFQYLAEHGIHLKKRNN